MARLPRWGLELRFMPEYTGSFRHMLHDLMVSGPDAVAADVDLVTAPG